VLLAVVVFLSYDRVAVYATVTLINMLILGFHVLRWPFRTDAVGAACSPLARDCD
jgi:hypothetical protein